MTSNEKDLSDNSVSQSREIKSIDYQMWYRDWFIKWKEEVHKLLTQFYINTWQIPPITIPKWNIQSDI